MSVYTYRHSVYVLRRRTSTRVYADMERMQKSVRVHTKRVYVRTRVDGRRRGWCEWVLTVTTYKASKVKCMHSLVT